MEWYDDLLQTGIDYVTDNPLDVAKGAYSLYTGIKQLTKRKTRLTERRHSQRNLVWLLLKLLSLNPTLFQLVLVLVTLTQKHNKLATS